MIDRPFTVLRPFHPLLRDTLLTKEDHIRTGRDLAKFFPNTPIASLHQMHGSRAIRVTGSTSRVEEADAMATDARGLLLTIRAADCQNFVVYAPVKHVIAVAHVGWRGIETGTIPSDRKRRSWVRGHRSDLNAPSSVIPRTNCRQSPLHS
ncbi:laccase domain-containing protein [Candidatus Peregrinibacteria bacterium]|nr:laccase domain-containing protein [Candidatus Peregrinibacteria bacterium]